MATVGTLAGHLRGNPGREINLATAQERARSARLAAVAAVADECEASTVARAYDGNPDSVVYLLTRVSDSHAVPSLDVTDEEIDAVLSDMACGVLSTVALPHRRG